MTRAFSVSPLWAWVIALIFVLPLPAPLFIPSMEARFVETLDSNYYLKALDEYFQVPQTGRLWPKGVMLTMSGGSCATIGPLRLMPDGVEMYVIYYPGAVLSDFYGVADTLIYNKPDFIVIQDTVLTYSRSQLSRLYRQLRQYWRNVFFALSGLQDPRAGAPLRCGAKHVPQKDWPDMVNKIIAGIDPYSEQKRVNVEKFLNHLSDKKTPIIVVSPPLNEYTRFYRSQIFGMANTIIQRSPSLSGVSLHRQSEATPAVQFLDPTHLSPSASGAYRSWLNAEIERALRIKND